MSVVVNSCESKAAVMSLIVFFLMIFLIINLSNLNFNLRSDIRFNFPKRVIRDQNVCLNIS